MSVFLVENDDDKQNGSDPQYSLSLDSSADHFNMPNFVLQDDISQDTEQGEEEQVSVESSLTFRNRTWPTHYVLPKFPVDIEEFLQMMKSDSQALTPHIKSRIVNVIYNDMSKYQM